MGNRAVITTTPFSEDNVGIYVHWNGGQESVEGFIRAAKALGYRDPTDDSYGIARLTQAIGLFFGGEISLGIDTVKNLDTNNGDNGTWLIGPGWEITGGKFGAKVQPLTPEQVVKADEIALTIIAKTKAAEAAKA